MFYALLLLTKGLIRQQLPLWKNMLEVRIEMFDASSGTLKCKKYIRK